ncbi:MAG: peroxiredoxin [Gammaproteobacteria bacterium]|nr:peroxiredoxin [Gammaproteobacteria bacterium]
MSPLRYHPRLLIGLMLFSLLVSGVLATDAPEVGESAPDFRLQDQTGEWRSLDDYRGKWLALYFYPKDDTPGCTTEACEFRDNIFAFREIGAEIVGVSLDDVESHREFAEKYHLPFTLLSDPDGEIARTYGVLKNIGPVKFARRESFLIDPEGKIAKHYPEVDPDGHSEEVLADLTALQTAG